MATGSEHKTEIEVTPEMIEAGVDEFFSTCSDQVELTGSLTVSEMVSRLVHAALNGRSYRVSIEIDSEPVFGGLSTRLRSL